MADSVPDVRAAAQVIRAGGVVGSLDAELAVRAPRWPVHGNLDPDVARKVDAYIAGAVPGQSEALDAGVGGRAAHFATTLCLMFGAKASISSVEAHSATIQIALDSESKLFVEVKPTTIEAVIYRKGSGIEDVVGDDEHSLLHALTGLS